MSDALDLLKKRKKQEMVLKQFKTRKQQIDNELNRIKQVLLSDSVTDLSLVIHLKVDKNGKGSLYWKEHEDVTTDLTFAEDVKKMTTVK